jgi:hypothetical protein
MLNGQSSTLRPTAGLMQSLQAGRQNSALLSSLSSSGPATGPLGSLPTLTTRANAAFGNPQEELTLAEQLVRANAKREPSGGATSGLAAYVQELQAQLGSGPQLFGQGWPHEWFG